MIKVTSSRAGIFYRSRLFISILLLAGYIKSGVIAAEDQEEVVVIGVTPSSVSGLPETKIPYNVRSVTSEEIENSQSLDVTELLNRRIGSIHINEAQNNPLQPDLQYRGFTASPLLGLAQGIAVHQNGVRINEPLGDTANWDLLPETAIHGITLIGGANPLFGLNALGGALSIDMKDGFNTQGHNLKVQAGSFGRIVASIESGNKNDNFAYYGNIHYFEEDGWRDLSASDAVNFYGSIGWRGQGSDLNLNFQHGTSELTGNGASPVELLAIDRPSVFTAPDITRNNLFMISTDFSHEFSQDTSFTGIGFYRSNSTDSFNGDASEFSICELENGRFLVEGIDGDKLTGLGLDEEAVCGNNVLVAADPAGLESTLNALLDPGDGEFNIEDLTGGLTGTGTLSDQAINNISDRTQKSYGTDLQITYTKDLFGRDNQMIAGLAWFKGESEFNSRLELAELDRLTRSTGGLGTGTFVDEETTRIRTETETLSFYFTDTIELNGRLSLTLSGRFNNTRIILSDRSGERPELNGDHDFARFNPAVGLTFQATEYMNVYAGYSESSRAPTPIELACNDSIFELAVANSVATGADPEDVDFECRLPNAFLSDPPLQQVIARSIELGTRGKYLGINYQMGIFHTKNENDIIFQTTGRSTGLFSNVNGTRRMGFESSANGSWNGFDWFMSYSFIDAAFEDSFFALSPNHPLADNDGRITVKPGDSIPGIPDHQLKFGGDYRLTDTISAGIEVIYNSEQFLRGDESNRLQPVDAYTVLNFMGRYRLNNHIEFFARINNVLDTNYETFGLLGDQPSEVDVPLFQSFTSPRYHGPSPPRSAFAGIKLSL